MQVKIAQKEGLHFNATTSRGVEFLIQPKEHISPLEYFALGLISCTGTDLVMLPAKQGHEARNIAISADLQKSEQAPFRFITIHIDYSFDSDADDLSARRWVLSSMESYCTTINTVRGSAKILYSITHNGTRIADCESIHSGSADAMGEAAGSLGADACPA